MEIPHETQFEAMAIETIWTTRLYVHYAVSWFVRTSIMYALRYGLSDIAQRLEPEVKAIETEMAEISKHMGAGA